MRNTVLESPDSLISPLEIALAYLLSFKSYGDLKMSIEKNQFFRLEKCFDFLTF